MVADHSAFSNQPEYKNFFRTTKSIAIEVVVSSNILVFFLLFIQVIRHKKWNYCLYWCFIVQAALDAWQAVRHHPNFVGTGYRWLHLYLYHTHIDCLWSLCGIITVLVWEYTFLRNKKRTAKFITVTLIVCVFVMAYDTYESELLLEIGNWKCEWNHSITDTFPYYTECTAAIHFLLLIIYVPTFLQAGLLVICMYNVFSLSIGNASRVTLKAHRKISRAFMVKLIIIGIKALDAVIQYNGYVVIWMSMYNYINEWPRETYDLYNIVYDLAELFSYTAYTVHGFLIVWLLSRIMLKTSTALSCQTSTISMVNLSTVNRN